MKKVLQGECEALSLLMFRVHGVARINEISRYFMTQSSAHVPVVDCKGQRLCSLSSALPCRALLLVGGPEGCMPPTVAHRPAVDGHWLAER